MGPRLNKRQQRELEELEALGGGSAADVSNDEVELPVGNPGKISTFSNFLAADNIDSASDEEEEGEGSVKPAKSRKKKKNKKKASSSAPTPPSKASKDVIPEASLMPRNEKKALKKAKAKEKKAGDDELERALAELSAALPSSQKPKTTTQESQSLAVLLSVSLTHLDAELEMRKFFGAKVIQANKSTNTSGSGGTGRSSQSRKHGASSQRSVLTRPQPSWWSASQREGLKLRALAEDETEGMRRHHVWGVADEKWWTVDYSQRYKSMSKLFFRAVMSGDPDALWEVQRKLPWHADNLLQLAEVYRHREEYAQAVDFVDRAIFTYERAFIGAFNFTSGLNRLDFDRVENRPFFLALHRQVADLQRRGCVRTAFEFARLLYSIDPWEDPHGALYHLDVLALKSGMMQWLVDLFDHFTKLREKRTEEKKGVDVDMRMDPSVLPGFAYARALALRMLEETGKLEGTHTSTAALEAALLSFPTVVPLLADKIEVALPTTIRSHRDFAIETDARSLTAPVTALHALSHMYVLRSFSVWKDPNHSSWFLNTTTQTFSNLSTSLLPVTKRRQAFLDLFTHEGLQYSIYRHITVLESTHSRLFSFIPSRVLREAKSLACDPLPPETALSRYDESYFEGTEDVHGAQWQEQRQGGGLDVDEAWQQAIPNAGMREQIMEFFRHPPGADVLDPAQLPEAFHQLVQQLGPDVGDDLLWAFQQRAMLMRDAEGGQNNVMPGQMPGMHDEEGDDGGGARANQEDGGGSDGDGVEIEGEGESGTDDDDNPSAISRFVRTVLGRFLGSRLGVRDGNASSSDESDNDPPPPIDGQGVD